MMNRSFSVCVNRAIEDNLYDILSSRYTRALARSMQQTKQLKAANVLNNAFSSSFVGGDGKELLLQTIQLLQTLN